MIGFHQDSEAPPPPKRLKPTPPITNSAKNSNNHTEPSFSDDNKNEVLQNWNIPPSPLTYPNGRVNKTVNEVRKNLTPSQRPFRKPSPSSSEEYVAKKRTNKAVPKPTSRTQTITLSTPPKPVIRTATPRLFTPISTSISAHIPLSTGKGTPSSQFNLIVPLIQDPLRGTLSQTRPIPYQINNQEEKKKLLKELKKSIEPVKTQLPEIERYFGHTGFSAAFDTKHDVERLEKLASKKRRQVKRETLTLDWGDAATPRSNQVQSEPVADLVHPVEQARQILTARFDESLKPPLTFINDVNDHLPHGKFQFVHSYIYGAGVRVVPASRKQHCSCPNNICKPETCSCLTHSIGDARSEETSQIVRYTRRRDGLAVLDEGYILNELTPSASHFEISECSDECSCSNSTCVNRVINQGRTVPLEIFETAKCGFGVRSPIDIVKGQFIDLYLGEVITKSEVERRENAKEEGASSYIYDLDWFSNQNCYHVDGEFFGTAMRFVNHCCSPNARTFPVQSGKGDKHVYYLAFFAIVDIPAGTEICINYSPQDDSRADEDATEDEVDQNSASNDNYDSDNIPGPLTISEQLTKTLRLERTEKQRKEYKAEEGRARCYCGADNCRGFLWRSKGRKRRRKVFRND